MFQKYIQSVDFKLGIKKKDWFVNNIKVKQSHYKPGQALRVPGG